MWVKWLCILVVSDALRTVVPLRIYEGEKHDQERSTDQEKSADQEGSASVLSTRETGPPKLQHSFGVKIEHPFGKDLQGRVVEQREHHAFGNQPIVDQQSSQHEFQPSQTNHASIGGEWRGISRFREHQDQQSQSHDLSQHQVLGQVLQGLGQVNQILGKNHQGIEQVNQMFGQGDQDYQKHNSFTNDNRELYTLGVEKKQEENNILVNAIPEVTFEKTAGGVNNIPVENKVTTNHDIRSDFKPVQEPSFSNLPKPSEKIEVKSEGVKTITITKEVPVPYTVEVEKQVPFKVEVPVDRPYPVERPKPYPVYVEKKVPYKVKEYVPQPYTVYKRVPYTVKVHVNKPYPVHVPKPYRVLVEKKVPYQVEKRVPYPVRVYVDKPYPIHVPVLRTIPYTVEKQVPLPVQVSVEKPFPVPVPKPYKVYVEKKVPYSAHVPVYRQQEVEVVGQPIEGDQGAMLELQSHPQHPQWREQVPMYQPLVLGREQSSEPTDQGTMFELQGQQQHPQWREHVPMHHSHELNQQEFDESRYRQGTTDPSGTIEVPRHQQHPQWREHAPSTELVPTYRPHELNQQEVDASRHHQDTTGQAGTLDVPRHHHNPPWREHYPVHVPTYHQQHERDQQVMEVSGLPPTTDTRLRLSGTSEGSTPQAAHNFRYLTNLSGKERVS